MLPFSPPPPQPPVDPKELFTSGLWQRWISSVYNRLSSALVKDSPGVVKAASGAATVVYTLPANGVGVFMATCNIGPVNDAANYGAWAMIAKDGSSSRIMAASNGALQTIALSGLSILSTQNSGSLQTLRCTIVQVS